MTLKIQPFTRSQAGSSHRGCFHEVVGQCQHLIFHRLFCFLYFLNDPRFRSLWLIAVRSSIRVNIVALTSIFPSGRRSKKNYYLSLLHIHCTILYIYTVLTFSPLKLSATFSFLMHLNSSVCSFFPFCFLFSVISQISRFCFICHFLISSPFLWHYNRIFLSFLYHSRPSLSLHFLFSPIFFRSQHITRIPSCSKRSIRKDGSSFALGEITAVKNRHEAAELPEAAVGIIRGWEDSRRRERRERFYVER